MITIISEYNNINLYRHDVGMHVVGQPARDLCRHFVERWGGLLVLSGFTSTHEVQVELSAEDQGEFFLIRQLIRNPDLLERITPGSFLFFCLLQTSAPPIWRNRGLLVLVRCKYAALQVVGHLVHQQKSSIQYKMHISKVTRGIICLEQDWLGWTAIQLSDHFVYIENQFFITS